MSDEPRCSGCGAIAHVGKCRDDADRDEPRSLADAWVSACKAATKPKGDEPREGYKVPSNVGWAIQNGLHLAKPFVICNSPEEAPVLAAVLAEVARPESDFIRDTPEVSDPRWVTWRAAYYIRVALMRLSTEGK